mgnify:CR=1 FL=1
MQLRLVFDSVDEKHNGYLGWVVDNIWVRKAASGAPLSPAGVVHPPSRGMITVRAVPNPIRDVHTTTFTVRGVDVEAIRVEVYDLSGRLVWQGEALGDELLWHTEDLLGRYLANGVYLYRAYVKVGGEWLVSELQKLAILR